ncbi:MAG: hypothetical protein NTV11_09775 [Rhodocyclales bacterium]|nr:hypothetical protein [Rhodocyclales bacterium]
MKEKACGKIAAEPGKRFAQPMGCIVAAMLTWSLSSAAQIPPPARTTSAGHKAVALVVSVQPIYEKVVVGKNCQPTSSVGADQRSYLRSGSGASTGTVVDAGLGLHNSRDVDTSVSATADTPADDRIEINSGRIAARLPVVCRFITQLKPTLVAYIAEYRGIRFSGTTFRPLAVGDDVAINVVTLINPAE